jgi:hypothetical protein
MFITNGKMLNGASRNINKVIVIATKEEKVREDEENRD